MAQDRGGASADLPDFLVSDLGAMSGPVSRRRVLAGLAGSVFAGLVPPGTGFAQNQPRLAISYGWDPDVMAPTEADVYVSPLGDDTADGGRNTPVRSLQRGVDLLAKLPSGSLSIRQGIYREAVSLDGLRAGSGYRIHRHGQERVRITAAEVLDGWQPCSEAEAAALGFAPVGVFVARLPRGAVVHGALHALNLHEAGEWRAIAIDRADMSDPAQGGNEETFHRGRFILDGAEKILAIQDDRLIGMAQPWFAQMRALVYRRPNLVSAEQIEAFDPLTGTLHLADKSNRAQRDAKGPVMRYALRNAPFALQEQQYCVVEDGSGDIRVYFRPKDPTNLNSGNLNSAIEVSLRGVCIDMGRAKGVELFGLETVRAAGEQRGDGICIRRKGQKSTGEQALRLTHCRAGETLSSASRGDAAVLFQGTDGLVLDHVTIASAHNSFGLAMADCTHVDMRFLHITGVSNSPARLFGLRQAVLAFCLFENGATDAHANKFNFYEGCDAILVYGVRCRNVGGYATYQEASRIFYGFCELDCAPNAQNRALVSQNKAASAKQGGADGSGDPVAGAQFIYWNNSLLADPRAPKPANSLALGPAKSTQRHAFYNNILHGGGVAEIYTEGADPDLEQRSHNGYTGLAFWQIPRKGWGLAEGEFTLPIGARPDRMGRDMRDILARDIAPLFPGFTDWDVDCDGAAVDWSAPPIGCTV